MNERRAKKASCDAQTSYDVHWMNRRGWTRRTGRDKTDDRPRRNGQTGKREGQARGRRRRTEGTEQTGSADSRKEQHYELVT